MKKIGLTLHNETYEIVKEIAEKNNLPVSTICMLIIKTRCNWYSMKGLPTFKMAIYENIKITTEEVKHKENRVVELTEKGKQQVLEDYINQVDPNEKTWDELMDSICGPSEKQKDDDELPF